MMLMFTRGHYSIDIFGGLIFGHYFYLMGERASWLVDFALLSIPFHKRFPYFPKDCFNCKHQINEWINVNLEEDNEEIDDDNGGQKHIGDAEQLKRKKHAQIFNRDEKEFMYSEIKNSQRFSK
jgi:hypothetical protein